MPLDRLKNNNRYTNRRGSTPSGGYRGTGQGYKPNQDFLDEWFEVGRNQRQAEIQAERQEQQQEQASIEDEIALAKEEAANREPKPSLLDKALGFGGGVVDFLTSGKNESGGSTRGQHVSEGESISDSINKRKAMQDFKKQNDPLSLLTSPGEQLLGNAREKERLRKENADPLSFTQGMTRSAASIVDAVPNMVGQDGPAEVAIDKWGSDNMQEALRESTGGRDTTIDVAGMLGGSLIPFGGAYKGVQTGVNALRGGANTLRAGSKATNQMTKAETFGEGAVAGIAVNQATSPMAELGGGDDRSSQEKIAHAAMEAVLGGGIDLGMRGIGAAYRNLRGTQPDLSSPTHARDQGVNLEQDMQNMAMDFREGFSPSQQARATQGSAFDLNTNVQGGSTPQSILDDMLGTTQARSPGTSPDVDMQPSVNFNRETTKPTPEQKAEFKNNLSEIEEKYVQDRMEQTGADKLMEQQGNAEIEWETIQGFKNEYAPMIKKGSAKIEKPVTWGDEEFAESIPKSLRAGKSTPKERVVSLEEHMQNHNYQQDVEGYPGYLKQLEEAHNTRKMDIMPQNSIKTPSEFALPDELTKAKPTYGYQDKKFKLNFESDLDKALYIVSGKGQSKAHAKYRTALRDYVGAFGHEMDGSFEEQGQQIREFLKQMAQSSDSGDLDLPSMSSLEGQGKELNSLPQIENQFRNEFRKTSTYKDFMETEPRAETRTTDTMFDVEATTNPKDVTHLFETPKLKAEARTKAKQQSAIDELVGGPKKNQGEARTMFDSTLGVAPKDRKPLAVENISRSQMTGDETIIGGVRGGNQKVKKNKTTGKWERIVYEGADDLVLAKHAENAINEISKIKEGPVYKALRRLRGAASSAEDMIRYDLDPIIKNAEKKGVDLDGMSHYMAAKRADAMVKQSDAKIQKIEEALETPDLKDAQKKQLQKALKKAKSQAYNYENGSFPEEFTHNSVQNTIRQGEQNPDLLEGAQGIRSFLDQRAQSMFDEGLINENTLEEFTNPENYYIPMNRVKGDDDPLLSSIFDRTPVTKRQRKAIRNLKGGSKDQIENPFVNTMLHTFNVEQARFEQQARKKLLELAKSNPDQIPTVEKGTRDAVRVMEDGEEVFIKPPKALYEAFEGASPLEAKGAMKVLQSLTRVSRVSNTITPNYLVRAFVRDLPHAYVTSNAKFSLLKDVPMAFLDLAMGGKFSTNPEMMRNYARSGAGQNTVFAQDREVSGEILKKAMNGADGYGDKFVAVNPKNAYELMRRFASFTEEIPKMAEFRATVRKGGTNEEAAYNARDIMDYSKAGASAREINKTVAFFNSAVQGKSKLYRSFRNQPIQTMMRGTTIGAIPAIGVAAMRYNYASDEQERAIQDSPKWMRNNFHLIPIPGDPENRLIRFPKPYDIAPIFIDPVEKGLENLRDVEGRDKVGPIVLESLDLLFSPMHVPTDVNVLRTSYDLAANYDSFQDRPIVNQRDQDKDPIEQKDVYTSGLANALAGMGEMFNEDHGVSSPKMWDYAIRQFGGSAVGEGLDVVDVLSGKDATRPEDRQINFNPITKGFRADTQGFQHASVGNVYEMQEKMRKHKKTYDDKGQEYPYAQLYTYVNKQTDQLRGLSGDIREVTNREDMTGEEKQIFIDKKTEEINRIGDSLKERGLDPEQFDN